MMDQERTPVIDALAAFTKRNRAYFNIPGHRGASGVDERLQELLGTDLFASDRTETDGLDDLHAPAGVIREAQLLAAELFGSDVCWFLVNGTTCANEAMILSAVRQGEKILVPRNAHKSVLMGLVLSGAVPIWMMPEREPDTGLYGAVSPGQVQKALERDPGIRAVLLVSPTYYGTCSDVRAIAEIAHARQIPLLVDEAHGAHFYFHEELPCGAVAAGADLTAQSTHKTLGSLTQSSMLHLAGGISGSSAQTDSGMQNQGNAALIRKNRVEDSLKLVQSTSPSYLLMASLDGTRHLMAVRGRELQAHAMDLADKLRSGLKEIPGIRVYHDLSGRSGGQADRRHADGRARSGGHAVSQTGVYDPCRVLFSADSISGTKLQQALFRAGITTEMADSRMVVAVITHANTEAEIALLIRTVLLILKQDRSGGRENSLDSSRENDQILAFPEVPDSPEMVLTPREAYFADTDAVSLEEACGQIAGETIAPYPPGIPLVCPGERITDAILKQILFCKSFGIPVHGAADPLLGTLRVIRR